MGIWATTQVKYGGRIWSVSGCSCNGWFKNLSQATNLERNKCRHRQCNQLQNLLRLWAELTLHWPFSFSQQRCHPHHRVNVSFFPISIALSFILFSLSLSLSLSASASLFCDSILYLSFCLYLSLFLLIFWFFDFSISRFPASILAFSRIFTGTHYQFVCTDICVVANELLVLKDKQRRHWPSLRSMCGSQPRRPSVFLCGNGNSSKESRD